jgi:hypothetical protein
MKNIFKSQKVQHHLRTKFDKMVRSVPIFNEIQFLNVEEEPLLNSLQTTILTSIGITVLFVGVVVQRKTYNILKKKRQNGANAAIDKNLLGLQYCYSLGISTDSDFPAFSTFYFSNGRLSWRNRLLPKCSLLGSIHQYVHQLPSYGNRSGQISVCGQAKLDQALGCEQGSEHNFDSFNHSSTLHSNVHSISNLRLHSWPVLQLHWEI